MTKKAAVPLLGRAARRAEALALGRRTPMSEHVACIDADHLARQQEFSERTFGPGRRTKGVIDHIRKELAEIEADPTDLMEWVDVVILAFDGAWRAGWHPEEIVAAVRAKQARNEARNWPDWRTMSEDQAIEHHRGGTDESDLTANQERG